MSNKEPSATHRFAVFSQSDYTLVERQRCFDGFFKVDKLTLTHQCFDGGIMGPIERELFVRDDATCLLPYDPVSDRVVLLEQFRVGVCTRDASPWLLELVAGINEPGETPESVARREAVEEAGIELGAIEKICEYFVSPGGSSEKVSLFCGQVNAAEARGVHGLKDEGEDIRVLTLSREEAYALVVSGEIDNAASIMALQWLQLNYRSLSESWLAQ